MKLDSNFTSTNIQNFEFERSIKMLEKELDTKKKTISELSDQLSETKLELEMKTKQHSDMSQWLQILSSNLTNKLSGNAGKFHEFYD